jgi:hypothetical protein
MLYREPLFHPKTIEILVTPYQVLAFQGLPDKIKRHLIIRNMIPLDALDLIHGKLVPTSVTVGFAITGDKKQDMLFKDMAITAAIMFGLSSEEKLLFHVLIAIFGGLAKDKSLTTETVSRFTALRTVHPLHYNNVWELIRLNSGGMDPTGDIYAHLLNEMTLYNLAPAPILSKC